MDFNTLPLCVGAAWFLLVGGYLGLRAYKRRLIRKSEAAAWARNVTFGGTYSETL